MEDDDNSPRHNVPLYLTRFLGNSSVTLQYKSVEFAELNRLSRLLFRCNWMNANAFILAVSFNRNCLSMEQIMLNIEEIDSINIG